MEGVGPAGGGRASANGSAAATLEGRAAGTRPAHGVGLAGGEAGARLATSTAGLAVAGTSFEELGELEGSAAAAWGVSSSTSASSSSGGAPSGWQAALATACLRDGGGLLGFCGFCGFCDSIEP